MPCLLPFHLCAALFAVSPSAAATHPYTDPTMMGALKTHGRHIGDIGGKPYVAHDATYTVQGARGQYPVYVYPQVDP